MPKLQKLEFNEEGNTTLDGVVVKATFVGPPVLGYYTMEVEDVKLVRKNQSKLPVIRNTDYPVGANAYAVGCSTVVNVHHDEERGRIWPKEYLSVQFYRIPTQRKK